MRQKYEVIFLDSEENLLSVSGDDVWEMEGLKGNPVITI
jgi:hypothetical protein